MPLQIAAGFSAAPLPSSDDSFLLILHVLYQTKQNIHITCQYIEMLDYGRLKLLTRDRSLDDFFFLEPFVILLTSTSWGS